MTITRHPLLTEARAYVEAAVNVYAPVFAGSMPIVYLPQAVPAGPPAWPFTTLRLDTLESDGLRDIEVRPYGGNHGQVATWERGTVAVSVYCADPAYVWRAVRMWDRSSRGGVWCSRRKLTIRGISALSVITDELDGAGARLRGDFEIVLARGQAPINIGIDELRTAAVEDL